MDQQSSKRQKLLSSDAAGQTQQLPGHVKDRPTAPVQLHQAGAAPDGARPKQGEALAPPNRPLEGLCLYLHGSIPMLQRRLKLITHRLEALGAHVSLELPLAVVPDAHVSAARKKKPSSTSTQQQLQQQHRHPKSQAASHRAAAGGVVAKSCSSGCSPLTHAVFNPPEDMDAAAAVSDGMGSDGGNSDGGSSAGSGGSSSRSFGRMKQRGGLAGSAASTAGTVQQLLPQLRALQQQQQQQQQQQPFRLVSAGWLDAVLSAGRRVPEDRYSLDHLLRPGRSGAAAAPAGPEDGDDGVGGVGVGVGAGADLSVALRRMPDLVNLPDAPLGRFAPWLGRWDTSFNDIHSQVELVLHGSFCAVASAARGPNESVRAALKQLESIETAVGGGSVRRVQRTASIDPPPINHEALTYAHAAAAVRGCSFPLDAKMSPRLLQQLLPFCGAFTARIIHELLTTGTCDPLERYRANQLVLNSRGEVRPHTAGGAARELFARLPGVGQNLAQAWFEAGCTSLEDAMQLAATQAASNAPTLLSSAADATADNTTLPQAEPQNLASPTDAALLSLDTAVAAAPKEGEGTTSFAAVSQLTAAATAAAAAAQPVSFSKEALYSLRYSADLLEAVGADDIAEMSAVVRAALADVSGEAAEEWKVELVGGGRRSKSFHDADFLVCHPTAELDGLLLRLYDTLVALGRLVPREQGFVRLQHGRMVGYQARARNDIIAKKWTDKQQMDSYDHVWGIFITAAGKRRRLDIMVIPPHMWAFALLGWTGSKQYLRFMRQHAGNCGMNLNSHGLFRAVELAVMQPGQLAAGRIYSSRGSGSSSTRASKDGSSSLSETLDYVRAAAAAAGSTQVVLAVPNEAPPLDRAGKEWWPHGWGPAGSQGPVGTGVDGPQEGICTSRPRRADAGGRGRAAAAAAAAPAHLNSSTESKGTNQCSAGRDDLGTTGSRAAPAGGAASSSTPAKAAAAPETGAGASSQERHELALLVQASTGSDQAVLEECDVCELLGIPCLKPSERCC